MNALEKGYQIYPNLQIVNLQLTTLLANGLEGETSQYYQNGDMLIEVGRESSVEIQRFMQLKEQYERLMKQ